MNPMPHGPASVLLIDHDQFSLAAISGILEQAGYRCHCSRDPESALKTARNASLDLIICDVRLDSVNGMELCQELRTIPGVAEVPVIYVSAAQLPDIVRRSHEAGGAYYLRKPVDPDVLLEIVGKALWLPHLVQSQLRYEQASEQLHPAAFGARERTGWKASSHPRKK